ncbi:MAG: hypothetical protein ACI8RD_014436 [Bacillariaceae sp.]|jgi:hypothetical protein
MIVIHGDVLYVLHYDIDSIYLQLRSKKGMILFLTPRLLLFIFVFNESCWLYEVLIWMTAVCCLVCETALVKNLSSSSPLSSSFFN